MMDPIERHRSQAPGVLEAGDPDAIKRLYVDLGQFFEEAHGDDPEGIPVLSAPETAPVVAALLDDAPGLLLDAGCGPVSVVSILLGARPDRRVVVLDLGLGTVRLARAAAARSGVDVMAVVADVEDLPFPPGAFDAIVCQDTIEHLPDDAGAFAELGRVLARRGRMVVATPNRNSLVVLRWKLRDLRRRRLGDEAYFRSNSHLREYSWSELQRLVPPELRIRRHAAVGWHGGGRRRLASRLVGLPGMHRLGQMVVLEVERVAGRGTGQPPA